MTGARVAGPARRPLARAAAFGAAGAAALAALAPGFAPLPLLWPAFVAWFGRDPERVSPAGSGLVLAPADGLLDDLRLEPQCPFFAGPAWRLGIYLSLFGVHVNRAPVAGRVVRSEHHRGRRVPTARVGRTDANEQRVTWFDAGGRQIAVRQIAGPITRGLHCTVAAGDEVAAGARCGFIALGSRTELWLPAAAGVHVGAAVGRRVVAGVTVLARLS